MKKKNMIISVPEERIESKILLIRDKKVMLDRDLAELYEVTTSNLNKAVSRNINRFPEDFMFQISKENADSLRFQIGMSKTKGRGGRRYLPYVFTELGVAMLSSVLNSERAIQINIQIMRAFTKLRELLATHKNLQKKIEEHDVQIKYIFQKLQNLLTPPEPPQIPHKQIKGFLRDKT